MIEGYQITEQLFERLPIGLLILDGEGNLKASNSLAFRLIDVAIEELIMNRFEQVIREPAARNALELIIAGSVGKSEFLVEVAGRTVKWTVNRAVEESAGDTEIIIVLEDVTEFQRMDRVKREFLEVILHKLRGPLSTLKTSLSMLHSNACGELSPQTAEVLDMGYHEANRLSTLLNDLRNLFYIDAGLVEKDLETEIFTIGSVLKKAVSEVGRLPEPFQDIGLRIHPSGDQDARICADFDKMRQVLVVFLKNAVTFSSAGSVVNVDVSRVDSSVIIIIRDQGIGVADDKKDRLFTKFFREDNAFTRLHEGNGLGLYIARSFIQFMGGSVAIDTRKDHGTTVTLMFPAI